jgi:hypothetical protein
VGRDHRTQPGRDRRRGPALPTDELLAASLQQLLADMDQLGLPRFKSWPTATYWFYPTYGANLTPETPTAVVARAIELAGRAAACEVGCARP